MNRWVLAMGILASVTTGAQEAPARKDYPQDGVYWATNWWEGFEEARLRNVPIHVAILEDNSEPCASLAAVYADKKFIEASRMWVNLPSNPGTHEIDAEVKGRRVSVCERFWNVPCLAHSANVKLVASWKNIDRPPVSIFTKAGLDVLGRVDGKAGAADLIKAQEKVLAKWPGHRLSAGEWLEAKPIWDEGMARFKMGNWRQSIDAFARLKKMSPDRAKEIGQLGWDQVDVEGDILWGEGFKMSADLKKAEEAKKLLRRVVKDFSPLPSAKKAQQTLDALAAHGH